MEYLSSKEMRVEKAWNKRGLAGLRSELLQKVGERDVREWDDESLVRHIAWMVYGALPEREWDKGGVYIAETCGLFGVDVEGYSGVIMQIRLSEETLREDIGDE